MANVLQQFREECMGALRDALEKTFPEWADKIPRLSLPSSFEFGELTSSVAHDIGRQDRKSPQQVAETVRNSLSLKKNSLIASAESVSGYINFRLDYRLAAPQILEAAIRDDAAFGIEKTEQPVRISVEHTSANPAGPLTIATARNAILGDALVRLLKARGHSVNRRFYVDDVGRQVSILAYGYSLLNQPTPQGKADQWFGRLYACTNCAVQIEVTKRKLKLFEVTGDPNRIEERTELQRNLDEWVGIASELEATDGELLAKVVSAVQAEPDPEKAIQELGRKYEENDKESTTLIRKVAGLCLDGIKTTLAEMDIAFDTWDWESQLLWGGDVERTLAKLIKLPFTRKEDASVALDVNAIVDAYLLRDEFKLSENYEIPPLTLVRSDGTTLYPTRDIAYSIVKFADSDKVINVIASEQTLPQLQIRLALFALGEHKAARNQTHYAYGLVQLPGEKMSKRRAHYVALDNVIDQAKARVEQTMAERKEELWPESDGTIRDIALGAIRFTMLNINSAKNLTFTWDRVLSLEQNSAPFINYAYTRAGSILRKLGEFPRTADFSLLTHPLERLLIFKIAQMPDVFSEAADQLKPEELAGYANSIAEKFHEYYEKVDVIHSDEHVKNARAMLVKAIQIALRNSMGLLGVNLSERM